MSTIVLFGQRHTVRVTRGHAFRRSYTRYSQNTSTMSDLFKDVPEFVEVGSNRLCLADANICHSAHVPSLARYRRIFDCEDGNTV